MRILAALLMVFVMCAAQTTPPAIEEVRVSSRPYSAFHLSAETNQVQVGVVVRDRVGHAVAGLKQSDFQITDEGKPRDIVSFSVESRAGAKGTAANRPPPSLLNPSAPRPAPAAPLRFIALYFEDYSTAAADFAFTKNAAKSFVENSLGPNDRVAVFTTSAGRITADYSADKKQITDAIDKVQPHGRFAQNATSSCPRITPVDAFNMTQRKDEDAIHSAITQLTICRGQPDAVVAPKLPGRINLASPDRMTVLNMAEQIWEQVRMLSQNTLAALSNAVGELYRMPGPKTPGSRMLLLVSDGFLTGTLERERDVVIDQALRAGVVINALDAKGLFAEPPARPFSEQQVIDSMPPDVVLQETMNAVDRAEEPSSILSNLAASTGGLYFHHNNGFTEGFRELGAAPETTYTLSFRPDDAELNGKYHKLKIRLTPATAGNIQARPGYFANKPAAEDPARASLDKQVLGSEIVKDFPGSLAYQPGTKTPTGTTPLQIRMHVDIKGLDFPERDGRHLQKLTFVFALIDKDGAIVSGREGTMEFALTQARYDSLQQSGVNAALTLEAPPGVYKVRAVAQEGVKSKMATLQYAVRVP